MLASFSCQTNTTKMKAHTRPAARVCPVRSLSERESMTPNPDPFDSPCPSLQYFSQDFGYGKYNSH